MVKIGKNFLLKIVAIYVVLYYYLFSQRKELGNMLTKTEIRKVRKKMYFENINGSQLAKILKVSNTSLSFALHGTKDLPLVERVVRDWINGKL